jgi:hypothetical protein
MSVLDYTGPITKIIFVDGNPDHTFGLTFHTNVEDLGSIETIVARYTEDGFKPQWPPIKEYMVNGVIEERQEREGPAGFPSKSAFLRA